MAIRAKSSHWLTLFGWLLCAILLYGSKRVVAQDGPSETECKLLIEKALKQVKTDCATDPQVLPTEIGSRTGDGHCNHFDDDNNPDCDSAPDELDNEDPDTNSISSRGEHADHTDDHSIDTHSDDKTLLDNLSTESISTEKQPETWTVTQQLEKEAEPTDEAELHQVSRGNTIQTIEQQSAKAQVKPNKWWKSDDSVSIHKDAHATSNGNQHSDDSTKHSESPKDSSHSATLLPTDRDAAANSIGKNKWWTSKMDDEKPINEPHTEEPTHESTTKTGKKKWWRLFAEDLATAEQKPSTVVVVEKVTPKTTTPSGKSKWWSIPADEIDTVPMDKQTEPTVTITPTKNTKNKWWTLTSEEIAAAAIGTTSDTQQNIAGPVEPPKRTGKSKWWTLTLAEIAAAEAEEKQKVAQSTSSAPEKRSGKSKWWTLTSTEMSATIDESKQSVSSNKIEVKTGKNKWWTLTSAEILAKSTDHQQEQIPSAPEVKKGKSKWWTLTSAELSTMEKQKAQIVSDSTVHEVKTGKNKWWSLTSEEIAAKKHPPTKFDTPNDKVEIDQSVSAQAKKGKNKWWTLTSEELLDTSKGKSPLSESKAFDDKTKAEVSSKIGKPKRNKWWTPTSAEMMASEQAEEIVELQIEKKHKSNKWWTPTSEEIVAELKEQPVVIETASNSKPRLNKWWTLTSKEEKQEAASTPQTDAPVAVGVQPKQRKKWWTTSPSEEHVIALDREKDELAAPSSDAPKKNKWWLEEKSAELPAPVVQNIQLPQPTEPKKRSKWWTTESLDNDAKDVEDSPIISELPAVDSKVKDVSEATQPSQSPLRILVEHDRAAEDMEQSKLERLELVERKTSKWWHIEDYEEEGSNEEIQIDRVIESGLGDEEPQSVEGKVQVSEERPADSSEVASDALGTVPTTNADQMTVEPPHSQISLEEKDKSETKSVENVNEKTIPEKPEDHAAGDKAEVSPTEDGTEKKTKPSSQEQSRTVVPDVKPSTQLPPADDSRTISEKKPEEQTPSSPSQSKTAQNTEIRKESQRFYKYSEKEVKKVEPEKEKKPDKTSKTKDIREKSYGKSETNIPDHVTSSLPKLSKMKEKCKSDKTEVGSDERPARMVSPVEDLTLQIDVTSNLRQTEHIDHILKLDKDFSQKLKLVNRIDEATLRDLKKLYESAIKPLEVLYKYRDLSNRHYGDAEIFSKPLILFMGPWSGGKSSIINYLLHNENAELSLRTGAEPSPAYFNILMYGDEIETLDGTQLVADFTFSGLQKFGQGLEERLSGLRLPSKLLEKVNIVEIPGILEIRKQVSRQFPFNDACQWFIDRADIILLVYDPSKLDVGPETEAILDQLKGREYQTRILLNKADQVKPEELMRVQGALIWNISPLMSSAQPPLMYTVSLWSKPYEDWAPVRLLDAQERALLKDLRTAIDKRIDNKIASARRFAVRVRNHAKMVDCYLTTFYNHKSVFGNSKKVADEIIDHPQNYHIYEGLSTLTNISRYDLPDPEVYRDFFRLNPLYEFQQLATTCTYFKGCPINRLDVAIAYELPELMGKHKHMVETAMGGHIYDETADEHS